MGKDKKVTGEKLILEECVFFFHLTMTGDLTSLCIKTNQKLKSDEVTVLWDYITEHTRNSVGRCTCLLHVVHSYAQLTFMGRGLLVHLDALGVLTLLTNRFQFHCGHCGFFFLGG